MFAIVLDGVLRTPTGTPINDGVWLYAALCETGQKVVLLTDGSVADAQRWLRMRNLRGHDEILGQEDGIADVDLRLHQIQTLRAQGNHVYCVIEPDPHRALKILAEGITVVVFAHPTFSRPDWRYTRGKARAWSRIVESLNVRQGLDTPE